MRILIQTDGATKVPREATMDQARALVDQGFNVTVELEEGSGQYEPLPALDVVADEVAEVVDETSAKAPAAKKAAKKKA